MDFIKKIGALVVFGLILAGSAIIVNPEARKDPLMLFAASMILVSAGVTIVWFFKKYPKPGAQFLIAFGVLGIFVLLALACNFLGFERLRGVFVIGGMALVLLILTLIIIWIFRLGSKVKITGRDEDKTSI